MVKRAGADLGAMALPKAEAMATRPFQPSSPVLAVPPSPPTPPAVHAAGAQKSLTVKLDGETYAGLRAYCYGEEQARGRRLTHQDVMVEALRTYLAARSAA